MRTTDPVCHHQDVSRGLVYDYCENCGAVRYGATPLKPADAWHVCDLCRLPGAPIAENDR